MCEVPLYAGVSGGEDAEGGAPMGNTLTLTLSHFHTLTLSHTHTHTRVQACQAARTQRAGLPWATPPSTLPRGSRAARRTHGYPCTPLQAWVPLNHRDDLSAGVCRGAGICRGVHTFRIVRVSRSLLPVRTRGRLGRGQGGGVWPFEKLSRRQTHRRRSDAPTERRTHTPGCQDPTQIMRLLTGVPRS